MPKDRLDQSSPYIRRQTANLPAADRARLTTEAIARNLSLTQYLAKLIEERIQNLEGYHVVTFMARQLIAMDPPAHYCGEQAKKSHPQPAKQRSNAAITAISIPIPVELSVTLNLFAIAYQIPAKAIIESLLITGCFGDKSGGLSPTTLK